MAESQAVSVQGISKWDTYS